MRHRLALYVVALGALLFAAAPLHCATTDTTFIQTQLPSTTTTLYTVPGGYVGRVESITIVNTDAATRTFNLYVLSSGVTTRLVQKNLSIAAGSGYFSGVTINIPDGASIQGDASTAAVIDCTISGKLEPAGTATTASQGSSPAIFDTTGAPPTAPFNLAQYGGVAVGAANALHVQPGTGAIFPSSQSGTWTVQQGTAPWSQRIQDGAGATLATVTASNALKVDGSAVTQPVSGPLTDAQLRASAVPVSGPLTDAQLRASAVPVSGPLTDAQLRAAVVPISGTVTSNQGTPAAAANRWPVTVSDGTNSMPTMDAVARAGLQKLTDGTSIAAVKAASTAAVAVDPALVVAISPNNTIPISMAANQSVNVAQLAGTTTDTNSGNKSAGTLRVVLATDQPQLTAKLLVTPDSVALPANQSVNVAQMGGAATSMNTGVRDAGTQRVTVATNDVVPVSGTVTTSPPANASTNVAQVAGTATDVNSGLKSAGTIRMVLATDQPTPTNKFLVTPDSVALPANQSTNINQWGGTNTTLGQKAMTASVPVAIASDQAQGVGTTATATWTSATALNSTVSVSTVGMSSVYLSITPTAPLTGGNCSFEVSDDSGVTYRSVIGYPVDQNTLLGPQTGCTTLVITLNNTYVIPVMGTTNFRVKLGVVITGAGSVALKLTPAAAPPYAAQATLSSTTPGTGAQALSVILHPNSSPVGLLTGTQSIGKISDITTSVVPGTAATNLGKAEDQAHVTGDTGVYSLGTRQDTPTATATANGDYQSAAFDSTGAQWVRSVEHVRASYSAKGHPALAATATDVCVMPGSATKTVRVTQTRVSGVQTTAGAVDVLLAKRSTADTLGTPVALTIGPHDSANAAATAAPLVYTANPTTGTLVANLREEYVFFPAVATAADGPVRVWDFAGRDVQPVVLRGVAEQLVVNFGSTTVTGGVISCAFEWTEE